MQDYLSGTFTFRHESDQLTLTKKLMRRVHDHPKDLKSWLEYVNA